MSIKDTNIPKQYICPVCGHVTIIRAGTFHCRRCKSPLQRRECTICRRIYNVQEFATTQDKIRAVCTSCFSKEEKKRQEIFRYTEKYRKSRIYDEHVDTIVAQNVSTLTVSEWLDTCKFFKGCALCNEEHIEARQLLVPLAQGGKYAQNNVFPLCGECATKGRRVIIIEWLYLHFTEEKIDRLLKYLKEVKI